MRDGMFVTDEQTVESMEDLEKLLFLWQEETNERMGEDTVSLDGEITKRMVLLLKACNIQIGL